MKSNMLLSCSLLIIASLTSFVTGNPEKPKAEVYYFHFNSRCVTCRTVESEARENVEILFGREVSFASFNLDEPAGREKGNELGVSSQMLLVVSENKRVDLTIEGFIYAVSNPDMFRKKMEDKIKPLL
ncbi:MAG: nitrophenyl compound nitroreductase subunit ArsF family protein [Bacteroidales bacterium]|nr:nitrophenyl compound nitroreductase subunit ArsF family protein [Bacteroidales bacterium]